MTTNNPYYEYKITAKTIIQTAASLWAETDAICIKQFMLAVCKCATKPAFVRDIDGYLTAAAILNYAELKNSPQFLALERVARFANYASLDLIEKQLRDALGEPIDNKKSAMLDELLNALSAQN